MSYTAVRIALLSMKSEIEDSRSLASTSNGFREAYEVLSHQLNVLSRELDYIASELEKLGKDTPVEPQPAVAWRDLADHHKQYVALQK